MNKDTTRYISFEQIARHRFQVTYPNDYHNGWNDAINEILECQPADVQEVKHGKWELIEEDTDKNGNKQYFFMCSSCGAREIHAPFVEIPYCWKCGAKMDGNSDS